MSEDKIAILRKAAKDPEVMKKLHPTQRMRLRLKVGQADLNKDAVVREEINALMRLQQESPELFQGEQPSLAPVSPEEHAEIMKRTAKRKDKFKEAENVVGSAARKTIYEGKKLGKGLRGQPKDVIKEEFKQFEKEQLIKFKKAQEESDQILEELRSSPILRGS